MNQRPMRRTSTLALLGGAVIILLLAALAMVLRYVGVPPTFDSPLATPTPNWLATKQVLQQTEESRPTPGLSQGPKPSPIGMELATPEATTYSPLPQSTPAGAGYIVQIQPPYSGYQYHMQNAWYQDTHTKTKRTILWAGAKANIDGTTTQQGVIALQVWQLLTINNRTVPTLVDNGEYPTPCAVGSIRVVGALGTQIRLRSTTTGGAFYFDVPSPQYISSPACPPGPTDSWTFSGDVVSGAPPQLVAGASITLYRLVGTAWEGIEDTTTGGEGHFTLSYDGPPNPSSFLLLVQYPAGYTAVSPLAGPYFFVVNSQELMSTEALSSGSYGGQRFVGLYVPNATPLPGTPTPPPLPPPPPGTWTPPPPTVVSPLATPTP